jgi:hypothetical protein
MNFSHFNFTLTNPKFWGKYTRDEANQYFAGEAGQIQKTRDGKFWVNTHTGEVLPSI